MKTIPGQMTPILFTELGADPVMATRNDLTGSDYFNVAEVNQRGGTVNLTIQSVGEKEFKDQNTGKVSNKIIITFVNERKMLTRGKSNINEMFDFLPDDTDDWEGEKVQLYVGKVELGPKRVDGVKVRAIPVKTSKPKAKPAPIEESTDDDTSDDAGSDDDVPY